jgi:hypothetical protein
MAALAGLQPTVADRPLTSAAAPSTSPQSLKAQGRLTLDKVLEIKEAGVDVGSVLGEDARNQLYRSEVSGRIADVAPPSPPVFFSVTFALYLTSLSH